MTSGIDSSGVRPQGPPTLARIAVALRDTGLGYWQWLKTEVDSARGGTVPMDPGARHVLIVAAALPPRFGSGVFRPHSWLKYADENGWRVSAVTRTLNEPLTPAGLELAATIPDRVVIRCAKHMALKPSYKLFARVDGGLLNAIEMYSEGADAFVDDPPSVVVGTGPPFIDFIVALFLARRFGARLVLDYRDEWTENPFPVVTTGKLDKWWESRCLKAADAVLFTTESQLRHTGGVFSGLIDGKGEVLTNGWEPDPSATARNAEALRDDSRLEIAFSGILGSMAPPGAFLADCARVLASNPRLRETIRLRFIGSRRPAAERDLRDFKYPEALDLVGQLPKREADRMARQSDVLLLMATADMARYMPGKMFEYMATGKPILVHGHPGEVRDLVLGLDAGIYVAEGDIEGLTRALETFAKTPPDAWGNPRRRAWAEAHTRERLAARFYGLLDQVVARGGAGER